MISKFKKEGKKMFDGDAQHGAARNRVTPFQE